MILKRGTVFILSLFFLIFIIGLSLSQPIETSITGESVTAKATSQGFSLSITIEGGLPPLSLILPANETYISNFSLPLNYTASNADSVWYNLDLGNNLTLTENTFFNTTEGLHTLYLYANNSYGETSKNVSFNVNLSSFNIEYSDWKTGSDQCSTNFNESSFEELQSLESVVFDYASYGKIQFLEAINVTDDLDASDGIVDMDANILISSNRIEINSTALPNFNKSANLWFYGLSFSNPQILKDGQVCASTICAIKSYSAGVLNFNVTGFSVYSARETPGETSSPGGGGGGGSGGSIKQFTKNSLFVEPSIVKAHLKQGEVIEEHILIGNDAKSTLNISLEIENLEEFIKFKEESFQLGPGEIKILYFNVLADEKVVPDLYFGKIILKTKYFKKEIDTILEIESLKSLFDIEVKIPQKYQKISMGEEILFTYKLSKLAGNGKKVDVLLEYIIIGPKGNNLISNSKSLAVETTLSHVQEVMIPEDFEKGKYLVFVKVSYNGSVAISSAEFIVGKKFKLIFLNNLVVFILSFFLIILMIFTLVNHFFQRKVHKKFIKREIIKKEQKRRKKIKGRKRRKGKDLNKLIRYMREG